MEEEGIVGNAELTDDERIAHELAARRATMEELDELEKDELCELGFVMRENCSCLVADYEATLRLGKILNAGERLDRRKHQIEVMLATNVLKYSFDFVKLSENKLVIDGVDLNQSALDWVGRNYATRAGSAGNDYIASFCPSIRPSREAAQEASAAEMSQKTMATMLQTMQALAESVSNMKSNWGKRLPITPNDKGPGPTDDDTGGYGPQGPPKGGNGAGMGTSAAAGLM